MIFYTLSGPGHKLEIHDDKLLKTKKHGLFTFFIPIPPGESWRIEELIQFEITVPKFVLWGKIAWQTFDGRTGSFRFSTNPMMVKKIEAYLQNRIIKNQHRVRGLPYTKPYRSSKVA